MAEKKVVAVDFKNPRDRDGNVKRFETVEQRDKGADDEAYRKALQKVLERAAKLDW